MNRIAVLIPCFNEALTIRKVVEDFRAALPQAAIYVYDNASTDGTAEEAEKAGAVVRYEGTRGKGHVVRRMFSDIQAECCLLVDGDDTYPAEAAPRLVQPILERRADMVLGDRLTNGSAVLNQRRYQRAGNLLMDHLVKIMYGGRRMDVLTGYRALSGDVIRNLDLSSEGFEIETEITVSAVKQGIRVLHVPVEYRSRREGSYSKLRAFSDGMKIIRSVFRFRRPSHASQEAKKVSDKRKQ